MVIYLAAMLWFILGVFRKGGPMTEEQPKVSVVLAARGPSPWLPRLLEQLSHQDYPARLLQIVVVDDGIEAEMLNKINKHTVKNKRLLVVNSASGDERLKNKNRALDAGIRKTNGKILLFTDADCQVGPRWVSSMVGFCTAKVDYVVGWSHITAGGTDWQDPERESKIPLTLFEQIDFLMLMLAGRSAVLLGTPWASSGQNQAFRRSVFEATNGYHDLAGRLYGDDALYLQVARRKAGARVAFADAAEAMVKTEPSEDMSHFLRQRIRWAADAKAMLRFNPLFLPLPLAAFGVNALAIILVFLAMQNPEAVLSTLIPALLMKASLEGALLYLGAPRKGLGHLRRHFPLWFLLQFPYITFIGLGGLIGTRLGWRERNGTADNPRSNKIQSDG